MPKARKGRRERPGDRILPGMEQALAYARGQPVPGTFRVTVIHPVDVKAIRKNLGLTQAEFAARFGFSLDTLRKWEQKQAMPDRPARSYLRVIEKNPQAVVEALAG